MKTYMAMRNFVIPYFRSTKIFIFQKIAFYFLRNKKVHFYFLRKRTQHFKLKQFQVLKIKVKSNEFILINL